LNFPSSTEPTEITEDLTRVDAEGSGPGGSINKGGGSGKHKLEVHLTDSLTSVLVGSGTAIPKAGDIIIEYHPHSKRATCTLSSKEFKASLSDNSGPMEPPDNQLWLLFCSREDFEFAELVHDASLNWPQIEKLIKLIQHCQSVLGSLTFHKYSNLKDSLKDASRILTPRNYLFSPCLNLTSIYTAFNLQFQCYSVNRKFEGEEKTYETWCHPLWSWVMDHLINPDLVKQFEWDAQKVSRHNGQSSS